MPWYFYILVILAIYVFLRWASVRPYYYKNKTIADFKHSISSLFLNTVGSFVIFDRHKRDGFLQLALHIYTDKKIEVEFGLPEVSWSELHFQEVIDYVKQNDFVNILEDSSQGDVKRFLRIFISGSEEEEITEATFNIILDVIKILDWDESDNYVIHHEGQRSRRSVEKTLESFQNFPDGFIKHRMTKFLKKSITKM